MEYPKPKKSSDAKKPINPFDPKGSKVRSLPDLADHPELLQVLQKGLAAGCGFIISRTSDGGAFSFTLLDGAARHRQYPSNTLELEQTLDGLLEYFDTP